MKPPRAVMFTDADVFAGTERHILDLAREMRARGADILVACPVPSPLAHGARAAGLPVIAIAKRGLLDLNAIRTLRRLLRSRRVDIVHTHNGRTALLGSVAVALARRGHLLAGQHFVTPDHLSHAGFKAAVYGRAHRWVGARTDRFLASSEAIGAGLRSRGDAPPQRISVIPTGLKDPDANALAPPSQVRAELGVADDAPLIVCVARLEHEKDIGTLVEAMKTVLAARPDALCVVAGQGAEREKLDEQIRRDNLSERVRLLGFRDDVLSLMRAGDLFVLPSLEEPFGLVLLEAMALSRPVVATRAGGPLQIVADGESGLLVPPADPDALAEAMLRLLEDETARREMGRRGRARYEQRFTPERMADAVLKIYRELPAVR